MKIDNQTLIRFFLGECNETEKEEIHQWLDEDLANKKTFINERIRFDASLFIDEDLILQEEINQSRVVKKLSVLLKVAAVILLLLTSGYFINSYNNYKISRNVVIQSVYVPPANRTQLVLPDGSLVWLNSNTSFRYPNLFIAKERKVEIDGEAYFEIAKDESKPFIIKTDKYNIQVLGTSFNLETYKNKSDFRVELYSGEIKIYKEDTKADEALHVKAGQVVELKKGKLLVSSTDNNSIGWKDGLITIENKSFEEIMLLLEKYYGVHIIIKNKDVKKLEYRGKLRILDGVDHALRVLQKDFYFNYSRDENNNIIYIY